MKEAELKSAVVANKAIGVHLTETMLSMTIPISEALQNVGRSFSRINAWCPDTPKKECGETSALTDDSDFTFFLSAIVDKRKEIDYFISRVFREGDDSEEENYKESIGVRAEQFTDIQSAIDYMRKIYSLTERLESSTRALLNRALQEKLEKPHAQTTDGEDVVAETLLWPELIEKLAKLSIVNLYGATKNLDRVYSTILGFSDAPERVKAYLADVFESRFEEDEEKPKKVAAGMAIPRRHGDY